MTRNAYLAFAWIGLSSCALRTGPPAQPPDGFGLVAEPTPVVATTPPAIVGVPAPLPVAPADDGNDVDAGEVAAWYTTNSGRLALNPSATPEDLSFTLNLIEFVLHGSEEVWSRMEARVERSFVAQAPPIRPAIQGDFKAEAARYHAAATPYTQKPRAERDPAAEVRLFAKALLLDSANADLYNHLAIAASIANDHANAERWAKLAIAVDPTFLAAYQELSYVFKNSEKYRDAVALVERAITIDGDIHTKALLLARKGQSLWMLREESAALEAFQTSRRLGGPAWVQSYLDGHQKIGEAFIDGPDVPPASN